MTYHSDLVFPDKDNESKKNQVWAQIRAQNFKKPAQTAQNWPFFLKFGPKKCFKSIYRNEFSHFSLIRMPLGAKTTIKSHGGYRLRAQNFKKSAQIAQNLPFFSNLGPKNAFFRYLEMNFHCFH